MFGINQNKMKIFLIDTSPDLRSTIIRSKIKKIDKVLYSHHACRSNTWY